MSTQESSLARYPMVVVDATTAEVDELIGWLTMLGAEGIEERDATTLSRGSALGATLVASFATREAADAAVEQLGSRARIEEIVGDAWRDAWKAHWGPTKIGARLVVVPSWIEYAPADGERVMRLDPGRAFGTGQHASTSLAVEAIEEALRDPATGSDTVLDVGTGSGILSFAAVMLGAVRAIGCDTDADAVAAARENATGLGLADRVEFRAGDLTVLPGRSRLVVANIEAVVLVPLASALASRVAPGGHIVLSGILAGQRDEVVRAYESAGLVLEGVGERDGWIAPRFGRRD